MKFDAGKEYNVVIVSFDPREDWRLAASKKEAYLDDTAAPARRAAGIFSPDSPTRFAP